MALVVDLCRVLSSGSGHSLTSEPNHEPRPVWTVRDEVDELARRVRAALTTPLAAADRIELAERIELKQEYGAWFYYHFMVPLRQRDEALQLAFQQQLRERFGPRYEYYIARLQEGQVNQLLVKLRQPDNRRSVTAFRLRAAGQDPELNRLTFEGCDFNYIFAMRLWSLSALEDRTGSAYLNSPMPTAAWLNPHLTTGFAVEISKHFNIQPHVAQLRISRMRRSGWTEAEVRAGL
jgi:hypothetical protein